MLVDSPSDRRLSTLCIVDDLGSCWKSLSMNRKRWPRMSTHFPDHETIRAALSLATRAPSVHNTQPWRWRVGSNSLNLYADRSLHSPKTDPDGRDLILSCGISLHHCVVALAALGWQTKVHRRPNFDDSEHLAAIQVYRQPPNELDVALAAAIPRRCTDRRRYSPWNVPGSYIAQMGARAARAGVMLRQVESLPRLQEIVAQSGLGTRGRPRLLGRTRHLEWTLRVPGWRPGPQHTSSGPDRPGVASRVRRSCADAVTRCGVSQRQSSSCWRSAPETMAWCQGCGRAKPPAWCC